MNRRAFTLVEIVVVGAIIGMLAASLAAISFMKARETAEEKICEESRRLVEHAEERYTLSEGAHSTGLQDLVDEGYLRSIPACPSKGVYAWENVTSGDPLEQAKMACSVHGVSADVDDEVVPEPKKEKKEKKKKK